MDEVVKAPDDALTRPDVVQFFNKALRLSISVCGSLKGGFAPQMNFFALSLPSLYGAVSTCIARAVQQGGFAVAEHSTVRWLRRIRCKILLLFVVHGVGIGIDVPTRPSVALPTFHPSIDRFGKLLVPQICDVALVDWMASHPSLREVEVMDLVDQSLNNLGVRHVWRACGGVMLSLPGLQAILPRDVMTRMVEMIMNSMVAYIDSGEYENWGEIRRSQYFVMGAPSKADARLCFFGSHPRTAGFSLSTRLLSRQIILRFLYATLRLPHPQRRNCCRGRSKSACSRSPCPA